MPVASLVRLDLKAARMDDRGVTAEVIATDGPFGNLVTNLDAEEFLKLGYQRGQEVPVRIGGKEMKIKFVQDLQRCAAGTAAAVYRFARTFCAGGESGELCGGVWSEAAGGVHYSAGWTVTLKRDQAQEPLVIPSAARICGVCLLRQYW